MVSPGWFHNESRTVAALAVTSAERVLVQLAVFLRRAAEQIDLLGIEHLSRDDETRCVRTPANVFSQCTVSHILLLLSFNRTDIRTPAHHQAARLTDRPRVTQSTILSGSGEYSSSMLTVPSNPASASARKIRREIHHPAAERQIAMFLAVAIRQMHMRDSSRPAPCTALGRVFRQREMRDIDICLHFHSSATSRRKRSILAMLFTIESSNGSNSTAISNPGQSRTRPARCTPSTAQFH